MGFSATEIWRFLHPFLQGLTWWQVYLHLREGWKNGWKKVQRFGAAVGDAVGVAFGLTSARAEMPGGSDASPGGSGFKAEEKYELSKEQGVHSGSDCSEEILIFPGPVAWVPATVGGGSTSTRESNGLLKLFGDLPEGGTVDEFLSSAGGAKLRSGVFWRSVAEAAGASFSGRFEFGGLQLGCQFDELGDLPAWCEEFALALTKALGFKEEVFRGAMREHPDRYRSYHSWYLVLGHLLETVWLDKARCGEVDCYFRQSRIEVRLPKGGLVEIASLEESFYRYLVAGAPFALRSAGAVSLINLLAIEWVKWSKLLFKFGIPWRTEVDYELFLLYSKVVFSIDPEVTDLETEIRRNLFKPGTFEAFSAE